MTDEIQKIKIDIAFNQAVIFIGGSISFYTRSGEEEEVDYWRELLKDGFQQCQQLESIDNDSFTTDHFTLWSGERRGKLTAKKTELIQTIDELGCPILTTNYDSFLEDILRKKPLTWNTYYNNHMNESYENLKNYILHLYGHFQESDSVIFTHNGYDQLLANEFARSKLQALVEKKTLLFIGYEVGMSDASFSNLLKWIFHKNNDKVSSIYKLVRFNRNQTFHRISDAPFLENIREIPYGNTFEDLLSFIKSLQSFTSIIRENSSLTDNKATIRKKYLHYVIKEYGYVSIFAYSNTNITLPLESIYVELKFDPTHPSTKAMKSIEMNEEFKRKSLSYAFLTDQEREKLNRAIIEKHVYNPETIYRDFVMDQWLNILLSNRNIFTEQESTTIKNKFNQLKHDILEKSQFQEAKQYQIQQAYNEFKHFIILGHPGSGKTTISKWLVMNIAKQCLCEKNMLSDDCTEKLPILIPIWKYVDQMKQTQNEQKKSLLQFIYENPTFNSTYFTLDEKKDLSSLVLSSLIQGNVLIIFEGLDEVPAHVDRSDLMKEINALLERGIDYDIHTNKLSYSIYEQKEIHGTKFPNRGNRFIITSRIEGNYFEDINFSIPRLTIENMSNDALKLFCRSYMECISQASIKRKKYDTDQLYDDITQNKDIFRLAINPQLASVIAAIYNQLDDKLPEKRIDLYEIAIEKMIERLVHLSIDDLGLTTTMFWSILQEIAGFLHSKVEGLSENVLREIIEKCLREYQLPLSHINDSIFELVDIFKYQAGVLNEFGYDSFRFIHRTFQEYLAAKSIIYFNGIERPKEMIVENIKSKIDIPNWRVPLGMTLGILSKLPEENRLFKYVLMRLLTDEQTSVNTLFSTRLVPFVIIDSLDDISFSSIHLESVLIQILADMLLLDYNNVSGFSRLQKHQELIHAYFLKLGRRSNHTITGWFTRKMNYREYIAPCAHILYRLKWYNLKFHEICLKNLHNDSSTWNWPIDSILRFYSTKVTDEAVLTQLKLKKVLCQNPQMVKYITQNSDWLRLITILYGGYKYYNIPSNISDYYEIAQFLQLSDNQRKPFTFYYQEVWDRNDPAYSMAVYLDTKVPKEQWTKMPIFKANEIYKESFLTSRILELLTKKESTTKLIEELRQKLNDEELSINDKTEVYMGLIILEDFDLIDVIKREGQIFLKSFKNRIEQLIFVLKDPIARCSSYIANYLLTIYNSMKTSQLQYDLQFTDYCRIYFSLVAQGGGLPIDTKMLAEVMDNVENKYDLYSEYIAFKLTGAYDTVSYSINEIVDECIQSSKSDQIIKSFLKISDTVQIYRPVRAYPWVTDIFTFKLNDDDDLPIAFFNCLENLNTNLASGIQIILNIFINEGYFNKNSELIPLAILLQFGFQSERLNMMTNYEQLLPELVAETNVKEFLLKKIQSMYNPYYKSRALYQLAEFYDEKCQELLIESFTFTKNISDAVLKFQVLEKIFHIFHYKNTQEICFIQQVLDELILTYHNIKDFYNRVIASIRLSFYGSREFRRKYLTIAVETLNIMKEDNEKIKLIIKLRSFIGIYSDLEMKLNQIVENLERTTSRYFIRSSYGRILSTTKLDSLSNHTELQSLFLLFAQLNDIKLAIGKNESIDQLWINLFHDINNQSNIEKILKIGLNTELFLTPVAAIVIDELVHQGKEDVISILFPYIIKPSNEVLPTVQRWFTENSTYQIKKLAALLLTEARHIFELAVDHLLDLLKNDNDQMRYRTQRVFQHPERDTSKPNKRISVLGEKTLMKVLQSLSTMNSLPRVQAYLSTFFLDLHWDDPQVFETIKNFQENNLANGRKIFFLSRIGFTNNHTWNSILRAAESSIHPSCMEELLHSTMKLTKRNQITENNWIDFARILSVTDTNHFREKIYFTVPDVDIIQFIINQIFAVTNMTDETYFAILESKIISELTIKVEDLSQNNYDQIKQITRSNFCAANNYNQTVLNMLNNISLTIVVMENLIKWLIEKMASFKGFHDTMFSLLMSDCLLSLISACVQKEDYLYRKITNVPTFNKILMIKLLEKMLNHHPYFPARGNAFILLAAMDHSNHKVMINAMNALLDENVVKEYSVIGIPLIHLSSNEFIDDLLESLKNESAIKTYEILKFFTEFALNEKIDAHSKSKIINYLANEIGHLKSKKLVSYYYIDIKIPFTTTLENELYKAWIKIQGLVGKTQYFIRDKDSK